MRKEIREILTRRRRELRGQIENGIHAAIFHEGRAKEYRAGINAAENEIILIEEELQRPDGSPASESGGQPVAEIAGSGI